MSRVIARTVALFIVVLALCLSAAVPTSAVTIGDDEGGETLSDGLDDSESSSTGLTGSSNGSDTNEPATDSSTDGDTSNGTGEEDSANQTADDESTSKSNEENTSRTNGGGDNGSKSVSDKWSDKSSNESTTTASNDSDTDGTTGQNVIENRWNAESSTPIDGAANVSAGILKALQYDLRLAKSFEKGTDRIEGALTDEDDTDSLNATPDDVERSVSVTGTLGAKVEALVDGTSGLVVGLHTSITGAENTVEAPTKVDGRRSADSWTEDDSTIESENDESGANAPFPSDSTTGVAVGIGAFAIASAARNGAVFPVGLGKLGSSFAAGFVPAVSRSNALDRVIRMLAPFRYSRYDDSDPLEHEARADVYEVVNGAPGAYLSKVADRADLPLSTARHHIRVLEREDLVSGAKVRGKRRFYPAYTSGIELAAALDDEATASVIDAVARFGSASVSDLAAELERDPSTISHHLSRLAEDGIVVREREGRAVINRLSAEARTALEPEMETDSDTAEAGEVLASD